MIYLLIYTVTILFFPSIFILTLVIFRQPVRLNFKPILISGLLFANVAPIMIWLNWPTASTAGHLLVSLFCFFVIFRYRLLASLVMTLIGVLLSMITEVSYYLIVGSLFGASLDPTAYGIHLMSAISIGSVNYAISALLYRWRLGFSFLWLKHRMSRDQALSAKERRLTLILGVLFIYVCTNTVIPHLWEQYFFHSLVTLVVLLLVMMIWLFRREWWDR